MTGYAATGEALTAACDKMTFVGSTKVGKLPISPYISLYVPLSPYISLTFVGSTKVGQG